jgi:hypothetical protein
MRLIRNFILLAAAGFAAALAADPALAQSADGGDARFGQGMGAMLNWAFGAGVAAALLSFPPVCVFPFMRNRPPRPKTRSLRNSRGFPD